MPKLLEPTDILKPRDKKMKELFEGYFRYRYGFMPEFADMYNEGIALIRSTGKPVKLIYMERFLNLMRRQYHPDAIIKHRDPLRLFSVRQDNHIDGDGEEVLMPIMTVVTQWPINNAIIEESDFYQIVLHSDDGFSLTVTKIEAEGIEI